MRSFQVFMQGWILSILVQIASYEILAVVYKLPTISQYTWRISARFPILPLLVGILIGHLFAQRP